MARAEEKAAVETVAEAEATLDEARRRVQQDSAIASHAERDRLRYAALVEKSEISRSLCDARDTDAKPAKMVGINEGIESKTACKYHKISVYGCLGVPQF